MIEDPSTLVGKMLLVGIRTIDVAGNVIEQFQLHGTIAEASPESFVMKRSNGEDYPMPPDYNNVFLAPPGDYHLRTTGEVIENPDFTATWDVHIAGDG